MKYFLYLYNPFFFDIFFHNLLSASVALSVPDYAKKSENLDKFRGSAFSKVWLVCHFPDIFQFLDF